MKNIVNRISNLKLLKTSKIPTSEEIYSAFTSFSKKEWWIFILLSIIFIFSAGAIIKNINNRFTVSLPLRGGSISEGIVGTPRFVNPVLANTNADESLSSLIYSGLVRKSGDGTIIPDLAAIYEVSPNGLVYTFILKDNIFFQDKTPITVDDVIFTINSTKDGIVKSPHKVNWDGILVEKVDDKTIRFTLKQPYASFLENATLGILPMHIWQGSPIELNNANTSPVGSGPYMVKNVSKQSSGVINAYELTAFKKFSLGEPYIKNITLRFYSNEDDLVNALLNKEVDQISSITPLDAENLKERNFQVESAVLPRVFGLFFNQNQNQLFLDKAVVKAINQAIDKNRIVKNVLFGYGEVIDGPIPPNMLAYQKIASGSTEDREQILKKVSDDLAKAGWKKGTDGILAKSTTDKNKKTTASKLSFSISTGNVDDLTKAAELIKQDLSEIGMEVDVKTFDIGNLNQNIIRPRKYDALLFGEIINHESDLYAFWHSSQRKDPGLNVALYTSAKVDKILEDASATVNTEARVKKYLQFEDEIKKDMPAVFLYSPDFIYIPSKHLQNFKSLVISPADRYMNVYLWYTETEKVWKVFAKN